MSLILMGEREDIQHNPLQNVKYSVLHKYYGEKNK